MTTYLKYNVNLTQGQKEKIARAFEKKCQTTLILTNSQLSGSDELFLTKTQVQKLEKAKKNGNGSDITISETQMKKQNGGNLFSAILPLSRTVLPSLLKRAGLSALSGAVSGGVEKAIKGEGLFSIQQNKVYELKQYKDYLTETQKKQINKALKTGSGIFSGVF